MPWALEVDSRKLPTLLSNCRNMVTIVKSKPRILDLVAKLAP